MPNSQARDQVVDPPSAKPSRVGSNPTRASIKISFLWCREQFDLFRFNDVYLAFPKGITPDTSDSPMVCHTTPAEKVSLGFAPSRSIPLQWVKVMNPDYTQNEGRQDMFG